MLRYLGSKKQMLDRILARRPVGRIGEYREPMLGGGSIARRVAQELPVPIWANDADEYLIEFYRGVRDRHAEVSRRARRLMPYFPGQAARPYKDRFIKDTYERFLHTPTVDPALRYYFCNRVGWNGRVNFDLPSRMYATCPEYWNTTAIDRLEGISSELRHWEITAHDYSVLLDAPGTNVWILIDPPYWRNTLLHWSAKLYRCNFAAEDHRRLAACVATCRHNVLLTYDDCAEVRQMYPKAAGYHHHVELVQYLGTSRRRWATELIITNYLPLNEAGRRSQFF